MATPGGSPFTDPEKKIILEALEVGRKSYETRPPTNDMEVCQVYFDLLRDAQTGVRNLIYRTNIVVDHNLSITPTGYNFVAVLNKPLRDEDSSRVYHCEVALQGKFPRCNFDFHPVLPEMLTEAKRKELLDAGFQLYPNE